MNRLSVASPRPVWMGRTRSSASSGLPSFSILGLAAALLGLALLEMTGLVGASAALVVVSVTHVGVGLYVFQSAGRALITPTGIYFLAVVVFVGVAGIFGARKAGSVDTALVFGVSEMILLANLVLLAIIGRRGYFSVVAVSPSGAVSARVISWSRSVGAAFLVAGLGAQAVSISLGPLPNALAFVGTASLLGGAMALLGCSQDSRARITAVGLGCGAVFLYLTFFFSGFARLNVVGLGLVAVMSLNSFHSRRWHKPALIATLLPALLLASAVELNRSSAEAAFAPASAIVEGEGLVSGTRPLLVFAELVRWDIEAPGEGFPRRFGMTFVEALAAPIPRSLWEQKPLGFGFLLTLLLQPASAPSGHSMTALAYGEWYVNFWWFGLLFMPLLLASVLRGLDRWQRRARVKGLRSNSSFLSFLALAILVGGLPEYVWAGMFTFVSRTGIRVVLVSAICLTTFRQRTAHREVPAAPTEAPRSDRISPMKVFSSRSFVPHE